MKYSKTLTTLAAAAALAFALPAQAVTINGSSSPASTGVGGSTWVTLSLDVSADVQLIALTFNLDWPSTGLALDLAHSTALGQSWVDFSATFDPDPANTQVNLTSSHLGISTFLPLPTLTAGTHTVQLAFTGVAPGVHEVKYDLDLGDLDGIDHQIAGSALVTVSAVPEPSPTLMLAAGLAALGLIARRRRA